MASTSSGALAAPNKITSEHPGRFRTSNEVFSPKNPQVSNLLHLFEGWLYEGFHKCGYPNSWMVIVVYSGNSYRWFGVPLFQETNILYIYKSSILMWFPTKKQYIWGYLHIYIYSTYKPSISPSSAHLIGLGWLGAFQLLHLRLPEHPVRAPGPEMGRWLGLCWYFTSFIPCKISCVTSGTVLYHFGFRTNVLKWLWINMWIPT